uniref:TLC domain-containing protein n=1 Tax=Plectus sambesii TaxID=2011161 RepID=A0A914UXQ2_9BILA
MEAFQWLRAAFWSEKFWWAKGLGWESMNAPNYPDFRDMNYIPFALAVLILIARLAFERLIARPLGVWLGVPPDSNMTIHSAIEWIHRLLTGNSRTARGVARPRMEKFCESSWRFAYYFSIWCYGWWALYDKPYLVDQDECWRNWPFQTVPWEIRWYYMIQSAFYWSLMISALFDVKRKDFWMMLVHHMATLALLSFSWVSNFVRIGALILLLHDTVDIFLELGKLFRYAEKRMMCNCVAVFFAVAWLLTRLYLFPVRLVYSTLFRAPHLVAQLPLSYYLFNGLLLLLQVLHIVWSFMIVQSLWIGWQGGMANDARSDDEQSDDERSKKAK